MKATRIQPAACSTGPGLYAADRRGSSLRVVEGAAEVKQGIAQLADFFQRNRGILEQRDRHLARAPLERAACTGELDVPLALVVGRRLARDQAARLHAIEQRRQCAGVEV